MNSRKVNTSITKPFNVSDAYRDWEVDAIKADLNKKRLPFSILAINLINDFNISCVIRSANVFTANKIYIYGKRRYDRRGTVGAHNYENIIYLKEIEELLLLTQEYIFIGLDNIDNATNIESFKWPVKSMIVVGQEQLGIPDDILTLCQYKVYIPQRGSVRSLNVASAASISMYSYTTQYNRNLISLRNDK